MSDSKITKEEMNEVMDKLQTLDREILVEFDPIKHLNLNTEVCKRLLFGFVAGSVMQGMREEDKMFCSKDGCFLINDGKVHKRIFVPEEYLRLFEELYGSDFNGSAFFSVMEKVRQQLGSDDSLGKIVNRVKDQDKIREMKLVDSLTSIV